MAKEALVLSAANLNVIEDNIGQLADNLGQVSLNVQNMDHKVKNVTDSVKTIEDEIKQFMLEIKGTTIVSNAKQNILMNQTEINKKFGHYDEVRRKINGILQASDMEALTKENLKSISQETVVNTPNYWLSPALLALSSWLLNDKATAERAVQEAIRRDDEKTSLLFALVNARVKRYQSAHIWLQRYLDLQDPLYMDSIFIILLDAVSSGALGLESKDMIIKKLSIWKQELLNAGVKAKEVARLKVFLDDFKEVKEEEFFFIKDYSNEYDNLNKSLATSSSKIKLFNYFKNIFESEIDDSDRIIKIDKILDSLVFNYENEELDLRRDTAKNKLIIEENGDIAKANERFAKTELAYQEKTNLFSILTNISMGLKETSDTVKKIACAFLKDFIWEAYSEVLKDSGLEQENFINFKINDWNSDIKDGQEEIDLINNLKSHVDIAEKEELSKVSLFDYKMLASIILGIIAIFFTIKIPTLAIAILITVLVFNIYQLSTALSLRNKIEEKYKQQYDQQVNVLYNIIAEVVDYRTISRRSKKTDQVLLNFLNNLNYLDYIKSDAKRNIIIGGSNE